VLIAQGRDGMDEASLGAATMIGELKDGEIHEYEIHPEDFGLHMTSNRHIRVSSKEESKALVLQALENTPGAARDIVAYNAGLAIYAGNRAASIDQGIKTAFELIASGAARAKLDQFCALTRKLAS
jgi:anthranilate phosphoribosyltransferase